MSDPFDPSVPFDEIEANLADVLETAHPDRAAHFFRSRQHLAAGKTVRLAAVSDREQERQLPFLKELPVDRVETARDISPAVEARVDLVVRARRGEDLPGAAVGRKPRTVERVTGERRKV